jgi:hypothetical protein
VLRRNSPEVLPISEASGLSTDWQYPRQEIQALHIQLKHANRQLLVYSRNCIGSSIGDIFQASVETVRYRVYFSDTYARSRRKLPGQEWTLYSKRVYVLLIVGPKSSAGRLRPSRWMAVIVGISARTGEGACDMSFWQEARASSTNPHSFRLLQGGVG